MKRRSFFLALSLLIILSRPFYSVAQESQSKTLEHLDFLYNRGEFGLLISELRQQDLIQETEELLLLGKAHRGLFHYDTAQYFYNKVTIEPSANDAQRLNALIGLIELYTRENEFKNAREYLAKAAVLSDKIQDSDARSFIDFYDKYLNNPEDISGFEEILSEVSDQSQYAFDLYSLFVGLLIGGNQLSLAEEYLKKFNEIAADLSSHGPKKAANLLTNGFFLFQSQQPIKSIRLFETQLYPLVINIDSDWARYYLTEYYRISSFPYSSLGDYKRVADNYKKYLELAPYFLDKEHPRYAQIYESLVFVYNYLGNKELASHYRQLAIARYRGQEDQENLIRGIFSEAQSLIQRNQEKQAIPLLKQVIDFEHLLWAGKAIKAEAYYELAKIHYNRKESTKGIQSIKEYLNTQKILFEGSALEEKAVYSKASNLQIKLFELENNEKEIAAIYARILSKIDLDQPLRSVDQLESINYLSARLMAQNQLDSASYLLEKVFSAKNSVATIKGTASLKAGFVKTLRLKSQLHLNEYQSNGQKESLQKAYQELSNAVDLIALNRKSYRPVNDRLDQLASEKPILESGVAIAYELYQSTKDEKYLADLFRFMESGKSAQLLESLNRNLAIQKTGVPDSTLLTINNLKQQASFLESYIAGLEQKELTAKDSSDLLDYRALLANNLVTYQEALLQLERHSPNFYEINYNQELASISSVKSTLKSNEAILKYTVTGDDIYLLAMTSTQTTLEKLPFVESKTVQKFRQVIQPEYFEANQQKAFGEYAQLGSQLYDGLLDKALSSFSENINKLFIIPDKQLNYLPFESLIQSAPELKSSIANYRALDFVALDYAISYEYSATILQRKSNDARDIDSSSGLLAMAPSYDEAVESDNYVASLGKFRDQLTSLAFNTVEAKNIMNFFKGKVLSDLNASEAVFKQNAADYDILHLAMHALVDHEEPDRSKLVFSHNEESEDDNFLHNFEIYNMNLPAEMVVLSACNTGNGQLKNGEGVMSIARAFSYAGAHSVVMSHWKVDDKITSQLMTLFYKNLKEGMRKDQALRQAKLQLMAENDPAVSNPYYWGAFVVIGDTSPINNGDQRLWYWLLEGGFFVILFLTIYLMKKGRN